MNLEGSVIIVTGSATGLGSAVARLSASKGAKVVVNYTKSETDAQETASRPHEDVTHGRRSHLRGGRARASQAKEACLGELA